MRLLPVLPLLVALAACSSLGPGERTSDPGGALAPEATLRADRLYADLAFLAADELLGRRAGTSGADAAARYIAAQFRAAGARPAPGTDGYLQPVPLVRIAPPADTRLVLDGAALRHAADLLVLGGGAYDGTAPVVYAGYGLTAADYDGLDVDGAIVLTRPGGPGDEGLGAAFRLAPQKQAAAATHGAVAVAELYAGPLPWANIVGYLGGTRTTLDADGARGPTLLWIDATDADWAGRLRAGDVGEAMLSTSGLRRTPAPSPNVVAVIRGADPELRDEYVALVAHYDHLGAGLDRGPGATPADSIFNGARDNAMGAVALIGAARAFAASPPARSVLLLAVTAEEDGLLGSSYYVAHPLVPLSRTVFALNIDGAGYSDTTVATVIGLGRTTADSLLRAGAEAYGLDLIPDPAPEQNLFDRSDNVSFARRGVPAPTFSPGFRAFTDPGVADFYHRPQDEADTVDRAYLLRFVQAYVGAARRVADAPVAPTWVEGDPYAPAGTALYGTR